MRPMLLRDFRTLKRGAVPALLLMGFLLIFCPVGAAVTGRGAADREPAAVLALVDGEDSLLSRMCISLVEQQDFLQATLTVEQVEAAEAAAGLAEGRYGAVLTLPEGYTEAILRGTPVTLSLQLSEGALLQAELFKKVAACGSLLLSAGQYGVFAGEELIAREGLSEELHSRFLTVCNSSLLELALSGYGEFFRVETLPYRDTGLPLLAHYLLCWGILLLSLALLTLSPGLTGDLEGELPGRLRACGITALDLLLGKYLWPFLLRLALALPLLLLGGQLLGVSCSAVRLGAGVLALLLYSSCCSSLSLLLAGKKGQTGLPVVLALCELFLSGGLLPRSLLPDALLWLGDSLPAGCLRRLLAPCLGAAEGGGLLLLAAEACLSLLAVLGRLEQSYGGRGPRLPRAHFSHVLLSRLTACISRRAAASPAAGRPLFFAFKRSLKSAFCPLFLLLCLLLPPCLYSLGSRESLPPAGCCIDRQETADADALALSQALSELGFLVYTDAEKLENDVLSGSLDCGILIPAELSVCLKERRTGELLTLLLPEDASAAPLYREQAAAALFSLYAPYLTCDAISGSGLTEEEVLSLYREKLASGALVTIRLSSARGAAFESLRARRYGLGALGLLLSLGSFYGGCEALFRDRSLLSQRLSPRALRCGLLWPGLFSLWLLFALSGAISLALMGLLSCLPALLLYVALLLGTESLLLWVFKTRLSALPSLLTALGAALSPVLCPVFADLSLLWPPLARLRLLLPLGWFLGLAG